MQAGSCFNRVTLASASSSRAKNAFAADECNLGNRRPAGRFRAPRTSCAYRPMALGWAQGLCVTGRREQVPFRYTVVTQVLVREPNE
jgi:hypothetical protein